MSIQNGSKPLDDFVPWPDRGPDRPPKVKGRRVSRQVSRPQENWRPEYADMIMAMTAAGMSAQAIANAMRVRFSVFKQWAETNFSCQRAIAKGQVGVKIVAIKGLVMRAAGFYVDSEKVFFNSKTGEVVRAKTRDYYPPEREAAVALLNRRGPDDESPAPFSPPARVEHSGPGGAPLQIGDTVTYNALMMLGSSPDDQQKAAAAYQQLLKASRGRK